MENKEVILSIVEDIEDMPMQESIDMKNAYGRAQRLNGEERIMALKVV